MRLLQFGGQADFACSSYFPRSPELEDRNGTSAERLSRSFARAIRKCVLTGAKKV